MDSAQGSQRDKPYMPIWVVRPEQGQSDAHRITRDIHHRTCSSNLTFQHLKARLNPSKPRQLRLYLGSSAVCLQNQSQKNSVLIGRGGHSSQPEPEPPIHRCSLIFPQVPVHCGSAECSGLHLSRAPLSASCRGRAGSLLRLSTGTTGLPPPVVLPLASKPLSLSLCPYQGSAAGPGARPHSLNYRLRRTQCSLLCADRDTFMARVQS